MKKILFALVLLSLLCLPAMSNNAVASWGEPGQYSTGVDGTDGTAELVWEIPMCYWVYSRLLDPMIEYRSTSPKSAQEGGFDLSEMAWGGDWVADPTVPYGGVWYGWVTFGSYINAEAKRGVNHGDITLTWLDDDGILYTITEWSFNVRHRTK